MCNHNAAVQKTCHCAKRPQWQGRPAHLSTKFRRQQKSGTESVRQTHLNLKYSLREIEISQGYFWNERKGGEIILYT